MIKQMHSFISIYLRSFDWHFLSLYLFLLSLEKTAVMCKNTIHSALTFLVPDHQKLRQHILNIKHLGGFHKPLAIWWEIKLQEAIELVLRGDQHLWWMDGRWCYYSKYWTNTQQENELRAYLCLYVCERMQVGVCIQYWSCKYLPSLIIFIELL